jgi:hypothetical protein
MVTLRLGPGAAGFSPRAPRGDAASVNLEDGLCLA